MWHLGGASAQRPHPFVCIPPIPLFPQYIWEKLPVHCKYHIIHRKQFSEDYGFSLFSPVFPCFLAGWCCVANGEKKILIKSKFEINKMFVISEIYCNCRDHGPRTRDQARPHRVNGRLEAKGREAIYKKKNQNYATCLNSEKPLNAAGAPDAKHKLRSTSTFTSRTTSRPGPEPQLSWTQYPQKRERHWNGKRAKGGQAGFVAKNTLTQKLKSLNIYKRAEKTHTHTYTERWSSESRN